MKFIGQFIQHFIAKFKNDVYLEDISTGTIASGGNLGLDSNNKIVKANEATGDITAVTITTDSGSGSKASDTEGSADFSILGTSGVGVTNSGATITVTSVPGEIDHDSLNNFEDGEHFTQANITTTGTITTGTWQGTAIATDQQKHLAHFCFKGYSTGDGTNYEMQDQLSDTNAPYEHNTSIGADGLTATTQQVWMRTGGMVMPHGGTLKKWIGWSASAGSGTVDIGLFKVTPVRNLSSSISAVQLINTRFTALGNAKLEDFLEESFSVSFAAGDMIVSAVKNSTSGKICYFSSTLEVEWS
tara:strand:- start:202 stop:1104 length:903 start_codon:yes stop_codon:yes gene_type:complete